MSFDASVTSFEVIAPALSGNMMVVGADLAAPAPDTSIKLLVPAIGALIPDAPTVAITLKTGQVFDVELTAAAPDLISSADSVWGVLFETPLMSLSSEWFVGGSFVVSIDAPAPAIVGKTDNSWAGSIRAPAPAVSARMYLQQLWATALEVTPAELTIGLIEISHAEYDETTDSWTVGATTWCVNSKTSVHSAYDNFSFNSFARFNGVDIALNDSGIFSIGGDTDDGEDIDAKVMFAPSNFGTDVVNRVDSVYLNVRGASSMNILTTFDEEEVRRYEVDASNDQRGLHTKRRKIGKGLSGNNIQIGVENRDGNQFDIESLVAVVVPLARKS